MAWTAPRTWVTAELVTAALMNTHVRDNFLVTGPAIVTTAGDILYATAANVLARLGIGSAYQPVAANSGATAPAYTWQEVLGPGTQLTIASDAITITGSLHSVDTEGAAASDDLSTINGGQAGQLLVLSTVNDARDVTVKHNVNNIVCGADKVLDSSWDQILLIRKSTGWCLLSYGDNV